MPIWRGRTWSWIWYFSIGLHVGCFTEYCIQGMLLASILEPLGTILEAGGTLAAGLAPLWEDLEGPGSGYRIPWVWIDFQGGSRILSSLKLERERAVFGP